MKLRALLKQVGFEIGILLFIAMSFFIYQNTSRFLALSKEIQNINLILSEIYSATALVERAETSQRGYVISGNNEFLKAYSESVNHLHQKINYLEALVVGYEVQIQQTVKMRGLIKKRVESMNAIIQQSQKGSTLFASELTSLDTGNEITEEIRNLSGQMVNDEKEILDGYVKQAEAAAQNIALLLIAGGIFALGTIIVSRNVIKNDIRVLKAKDQKLQEHATMVEKANSDLQKHMSVLNSIIHSMSDGVIVTDEKGFFTHVNPAADRILGPDSGTIPPQQRAEKLGFFTVDTNRLFDFHDLPLEKAIHGIESQDVEMKVVNKFNPYGTIVSVNASPIHDLSGKITGAISVLRDISKRKSTEEAWQRAREAAIEGSRLKSEFLATMSHEIRTPMNGIIGISTLLLDSNLDKEQKDYATTIKKSAESLLSLINEILDHSKIEAGKLILEPQEFDLKKLIGDIFETFRYTAAEKKLSFELNMSTVENWNIKADPGRIRQIVVNLIGNALKFTKEGGVSVNVGKISRLGTKLRLRFEVRDTGIGIKDEDKKVIFAHYGQTAEGVKYGGTGLGLSICKDLVQMMGGNVGVESQVGAGSTFWFEIDVEAIDKIQLQENDTGVVSVHFNGLILVVEDQPVNQTVVTKFLEKMGLSSHVANNGHEALNLLAQNKYDLIIMDCQMPVLNGYDTTKKIREQEVNTNKRIPIIALTAEGSIDEKNKCYAAGMDDFLSKPLSFVKLADMMKKWIVKNDYAIDFSVLERLSDYNSTNDQSLILVLIEEYTQSSPISIQSMKDAVQAKDVQALSSAAHGFKSSSATLGATKLAQMCQVIEDLKSIPSDINERIQSIESEYEKAKKELLLTSDPMSRKAS